MENLATILSIAATAVGLLITTVTFLIKFIKAVKEKDKEKSLKLLNEFVNQAILDAEQIKTLSGESMSGEAKKAYAISEIQSLLSSVNVQFDISTIIGKLEQAIELTKKVNAKKVQ